MENPCIAEIPRRNPEARVVVQSNSIAEDAAAILNARYFVTTPSLFSKMLITMNEHIQKVWIARGTVSEAMQPGYMPCGAKGEPSVVELFGPDMCRPWKDLEEKKKWMVDYPRELFNVVSICTPSEGHLEFQQS